MWSLKKCHVTTTQIIYYTALGVYSSPIAHPLLHPVTTILTFVITITLLLFIVLPPIYVTQIYGLVLPTLNFTGKWNILDILFSVLFLLLNIVQFIPVATVWFSLLYSIPLYDYSTLSIYL